MGARRKWRQHAHSVRREAACEELPPSTGRPAWRCGAVRRPGAWAGPAGGSWQGYSMTAPRRGCVAESRFPGGAGREEPAASAGEEAAVRIPG